MEKESNCLEYKETVAKSYLKTVSAFSNYRDGKIVFGITDDYKIKPITDIKAFKEDIENQINDSIKPQPDYGFLENGDGTVSLIVYKGQNQPYLYNGKAYKRNDTSTIECDNLELRRLVLVGKCIDFDSLPCQQQNLSFSLLEEQLKSRIGLKNFSSDTLKTLELYSDEGGYNNAAYLLSDANTMPGIDIAVFGDNENVIKERYTLSDVSLIKQYFSSMDVFQRYYSYEIIEGALRQKKVLLPEEAFREAIANSLVHREYDVRANTKVSMHPDSIVITSPGGLPYGISEEQYLDGDFSVLRNPIVANVFHRLGIVEAFATGIKRIKSLYRDSFSQPSFIIKADSITVILPLLKESLDLSENEALLLNKMDKGVIYSRNLLETLSSLGKATLIRALNGLIEKGLITKKGKASNTVYIREK